MQTLIHDSRAQAQRVSATMQTAAFPVRQSFGLLARGTAASHARGTPVWVGWAGGRAVEGRGARGGLGFAGSSASPSWALSLSTKMGSCASCSLPQHSALGWVVPAAWCRPPTTPAVAACAVRGCAHATSCELLILAQRIGSRFYSEIVKQHPAPSLILN